MYNTAKKTELAAIAFNPPLIPFSTPEAPATSEARPSTMHATAPNFAQKITKENQNEYK